MYCTNCYQRQDKLYATNQLTPDGLKLWETELCALCEARIHANNERLKKQYPKKTWKDGVLIPAKYVYKYEGGRV